MYDDGGIDPIDGAILDSDNRYRAGLSELDKLRYDLNCANKIVIDLMHDYDKLRGELAALKKGAQSIRATNTPQVAITDDLDYETGMYR
jgi:hypothetical protein